MVGSRGTGVVAGGWAAAAFPLWLSEALDAASTAAYGVPSARRGEGGTIPFMGWLAGQFPEAQLLATGVLGGYTTFSTFSFEVLTLATERSLMLASLYAAGSVLLGLAAAGGGVAVARLALR